MGIRPQNMAQTSNSLLSPTKSMVALRPYMPPMCPFAPLCAMTFFHSDPMRTYAHLCAMTFLHSDPTCSLRAPMCNDLFALRPYMPPTHQYAPPTHLYAQ